MADIQDIDIGIFNAKAKVSIVIVVMENGKGMAITTAIKDNKYIKSRVVMSGKLWVDVGNNKLEIQHREYSSIVKLKFPKNLRITDHNIGMTDEIITIIEMPFKEQIGREIVLSHSIPDSRACITMDGHLFWCNSQKEDFEFVNIPNCSEIGFTEFDDKCIFYTIITSAESWMCKI
jgi:hypothetical protein